MPWTIHLLGTSVEGRGLQACAHGAGEPVVLIFGGMHGDEPTSAALAGRLIELARATPEVLEDRRVVVVPELNPDGLQRHTRGNANGVDLNRNFPTGNWQPADPADPYYGGGGPASEPETRALVEAVERFAPQRVLAVHAIDGGRHCVNYDGPAEALAESMARANGYAVHADMGYPTPGSFGTWCGRERRLPTVTLELPDEQDAATSWEQNREAVLQFVRG